MMDKMDINRIIRDSEKDGQKTQDDINRTLNRNTDNASMNINSYHTFGLNSNSLLTEGGNDFLFDDEDNI